MSSKSKKASPEAERAKQAATEALEAFRAEQLARKSEGFRAARMLWEELRTKTAVTNEDRIALRQLVAALPREQWPSVFEKEGVK